jgi:hypothetical protein
MPAGSVTATAGAVPGTAVDLPRTSDAAMVAGAATAAATVVAMRARVGATPVAADAGTTTISLERTPGAAGAADAGTVQAMPMTTRLETAVVADAAGRTAIRLSTG